MTLLVFGRTGQVARALAGARPEAICLGRDAADLTDPAACAAAIAAHVPDAVINAAAYTAVDRAESEEDLATMVNGAAPAMMARICAERGIPFVHVSTDYVFDGTGETPWVPEAPTAPLGAYGRSKLAGETGIRESVQTWTDCNRLRLDDNSKEGVFGSPRWAILRTSWVFSAHGANFVKTMLRLGAERDALTIVADQIGGPTPADAIAAACLEMAAQLAEEPDKSGIYHFAGQPPVSWADFAREIFAQAGLSCTVTDIPTTAYPTPAGRPLNSRLDCSATRAAFGIEPPDWRAGLGAVLKELSPT